MVVNIIFLVTMYPVLFVLYFILKNQGDAKNGYSVGVRMRTEWMADEEVKRILETYRKELKKQTVILAVLPLSAFAISYFSIQFTIWMIWTCALIGCPMIPYIRANRLLRARKRERGWGSNGGYVYADLKGAVYGVRQVKILPFVPPVAISLAAGIWGLWQSVRADIMAPGIMAATFAMITPAFFGVALWMDRQKNEVISRDSDVNINFNRARKRVWKNIWLFEAWLNTIFCVAVSATLVITKMQGAGILVECAIYTIAGVLPLFWATKKLWEINTHYKDLRDIPEGEDDGDEYWIGGIFYYNKNDRHSMVTNRAGTGTTMNLATPGGVFIELLGALGLAVIPISCVWILLEEFTPIRLSVQDQTIVAEHLKVEYEIPLSDILEAELIEERPRWSKVTGTNMDHLDKGTFHIRNVGNCEVLMDPQNEVFLRIRTADEVYYISAPDDEGTREIWEEIMK